MKTVAYISLSPYFDLQRRFLLEGYNLKVWFSSDVYLEDAANLKSLYPNFEIHNGHVESCLEGSDIILIDYSAPRKLVDKVLEYVKSTDTPIFGLCPEELFKIEDERQIGQELSELLGYNSVETKVLSNKEEILAYIENNKNVVLKVRDGKYPTFLPSNDNELKYIIEHDILNSFTDDKEMFIQPLVEGFEFNTSYYFNGTNFIPYVFITQEYKGAFTQNIGNILTGEIGTVAKIVLIEDLKPRYREIARNLEKHIQGIKDSKYFRGLIDINQILTEEGDLYFLEFTTRIGIPSPEYEMHFMAGSFPQFAEYVSGYTNIEPNFSKDTFIFGCCYGYGYPFQCDNEGVGVCDIGNLDIVNDIALLSGYETKENNKLILHDYSDRIALTYGKGVNVKEAQEDYIKRVKEFSGYAVVYRTDIGYKWDENILHSKIINK